MTNDIPELEPLTGLAGIANTAGALVNTPHSAEIIDRLPHLKYAVAVTEQNGLEVEELALDEDQVNATPFRVKGDRTVADLDSFLYEVDRRPLHPKASTLWGSAKNGRLVAIYNDHDGDTAGWRDDKVILQLTPDEYWKRWHDISGKFFRQNEFGDVIEELLFTVIDPDQADLLEVIDSVRASTSGEFESRIERANGGQKLVYKQDHTVSAGRAGQLEVPQLITLELRPWEGHPETYRVQAYFRVNVSGGQLALAVKLKPTKEIVRAAWATVTAKVTADTDKPVYAV
jgi:uncharacterized protein YfdQ (DUF2303 family)